MPEDLTVEDFIDALEELDDEELAELLVAVQQEIAERDAGDLELEDEDEDDEE